MKIGFPMAAPLACAILLGSMAVSAHAKITRTVEKTFAVQSGGRLSADTQGGNITIKTDDAMEVRIVVTQVIDASNEEAASKLLEKLKLSLEQQGNDVSATASYERKMGNLWGSWPPVQVSYTITVPRQFNLQLNTSGGNIKVAAVKGKVVARTSGGDLAFDRVDGDVDGKTSGGNVSLKEGTARADLSTSGGNVQIDRVGGPIQASTSGGNISAKLTEVLPQDSYLSTSGGNVTVSVPRTAAFVLDAETSGGDVTTSGLTLSNTKVNSSKSHLTATVNAGGAKLTLRTSGGDIRVKGD